MTPEKMREQAVAIEARFTKNWTKPNAIGTEKLVEDIVGFGLSIQSSTLKMAAEVARKPIGIEIMDGYNINRFGDYEQIARAIENLEKEDGK